MYALLGAILVAKASSGNTMDLFCWMFLEFLLTRLEEIHLVGL